jgi:hypothetical protein
MCLPVGGLGDCNVTVSASATASVRVWDSAGTPVGEPLHLIGFSQTVAISATSAIVVNFTSALMMFNSTSSGIFE